MDAILNQIENDLPVMHAAFYAIAICVIVCALVIGNASYAKPNFLNRSDSLQIPLFAVGFIGTFICFAILSEKWVSTDYSLARVAESEICHNTLSVHYKVVSEAYTDYAITSGRFNRIYARIQKFPEFKGNIYAVQLGDEIGIITDEYAQTAINEAINRYELYRK